MTTEKPEPEDMDEFVRRIRADRCGSVGAVPLGECACCEHAAEILRRMYRITGRLLPWVAEQPDFGAVGKPVEEAVVLIADARRRAIDDLELELGRARISRDAAHEELLEVRRKLRRTQIWSVFAIAFSIGAFYVGLRLEEFLP